MATVYWTGNGNNVAQQVTLLVTAVAVGGTLTAIISTKTVVYTCVTGDTTATAAAAWQALLAGGDAPPEFAEITWTVSGSTITGVAATPGTPFTVTQANAGGSTSTLTNTVANQSQSDVNDPNNWRRAGVAAIPVNGDDVIVADSSVPLLWNLTALAAVQFATYNRWQSFTGSIGLPEQNPAGFVEYRPTYFQFIGSAAQLSLNLGVGSGDGPTRERYDTLAQRTNVIAMAAGQAGDKYNVRFLGTNANNTVLALGASVGVATAPAEVSTIASGTVDGGGLFDLGPGVTFSGELRFINGTGAVYCAPATLTVQNGSSVTVGGDGLTYAAVAASGGSILTWLSNSTITALTLQSGSILDKSGDLRAMTITNATIDSDCQVLDPNSRVTWTNAAVVLGAVTSGPFTFQGSRTVRII